MGGGGGSALPHGCAVLRQMFFANCADCGPTLHRFLHLNASEHQFWFTLYLFIFPMSMEYFILLHLLCSPVYLSLQLC